MAFCLKDRKQGSDGSGDGGGGLMASLFGGIDARARGGAPNNAAKDMAAKLDIEILGRSFGRFAGADDIMDKEEFARFTKQTNVTRQQADALWNILDNDGSGLVSHAEFGDALNSLQQARAWLRYCPTCVYMNTCAYCQECNSNCENCSDTAFCARCWNDHPARNAGASEGDADSSGGGQRSVNATELLRTHLVIRPLTWAYTSPALVWLPMEQKAAIRQALRAQQQKSEDAAKKAQQEEEAALAARAGGSLLHLG